MKKLLSILGAAVLIGAIVTAVIAFSSPRVPETSAEEAEEARHENITPKEAQKVDRSSEGKRMALPEKVEIEAESEEIDYSTMSEGPLREALQSALDDEDFERTRKIAKVALKSTDKETRVATVDALGWFGEKAILDLAGALADEDNEIRDSAEEWITHALMEVDDSRVLFDMAISCMTIVEGDEDAVLMLAGHASAAAMQIIDPEDPDDPDSVKTAENIRHEISEKLTELIEKGGSLSKIGKELYEEILGE